MNYNLRPKPKLIDPTLLSKVNKVYIGKQSQNNVFLEWLFNILYKSFKDNFLFTVVCISLVIFLLYRYMENIKKKNKIIKNINDDKPIDVKLDKPINYSEKFEESEKSIDTILSNNSNNSNIEIQNDAQFDKDIERNLQMGDNKGNKKTKLQSNTSEGCQLRNISTKNNIENYFEPMANNAFDDNFLDYNLL
jgi:hypothetical protein